MSFSYILSDFSNLRQSSYAILFVLILFEACTNKDNLKLNCLRYDIIINSPYDNPVWHPSGRLIGFNHVPIREIDYTNGYECPYQAEYIYENDSAGFWLINADGTEQRQILPYYLDNAAWSSDGNWIAFMRGAQLYKMPFDGEHFDTTKIEQITFEGRNFYPEWSYDGTRIIFNKSICDGPNTCGIWLNNLSTKTNQFIDAYGNFPDWHPFNDSVIYSTNSLSKNGEDLGDSVWLYSIPTHTKQLLKSITLPNYDNRYFKYSPDGRKIAFISFYSTGEGTQLCIMNSNGTQLRKLTTNGCLNFSFSPNGKIVFVNFNSERIGLKDGTLWIMDEEGNNKQPLTFNHFILKNSF